MERNSGSQGSENGRDQGEPTEFDAVPDPTVVVDPVDGSVQSVNEAALELLDRDCEGISGTAVDEVFPTCGDRFLELVDRTVASGAPTSTWVRDGTELHVVDGDGDRHRVDAGARAVDTVDGPRVGISLREVGDRERHYRVLERLQAATDRLVRAGSREEVAAITADVADEALGVSLYSIMLYDPERDAMVETVTSEGVDETLDNVDAVERGEGIVWKAFAADEVFVYDDVREDPDVYDPETDVRSEILAPVGEYGVLVVSSTRVGEFDATDVSMVKALATSAEAALTRMDRERRLRTQTRKLRTIIDNAPIALFALDEEGTFTVSEGKALQRIGLEPGEAVGQSVFDLYADYEGICADARRALGGEPVDRTRELAGRVYETWYRPVESTPGVSTPDDDGLDACVIGAAIDVTERERRERLVRVLNRFLRHNLRNAMNVVVGYAERIDGHADEEVRTAVDRIAETGSDLTRLSEKARRLSEMAATEREVGTVDVHQSVARVVADLEALYGVDVTVRGTQRRSLPVPETAELAVHEICENAIKHPEDPAPTVSVTSRDHAGVAVVDVRDAGSGLPDQERRMLESEGETPLKHGSGLGLFVAYWAVSDAGGKIDVWKADDEGTGITITVPIVGE